MISSDRWVFIHIPKTAGKNFIKHAEKQSNVINWHMKYGLNLLTHNPLWWWEKENVIDNDQIVFTFVRNPYIRIASFYHYMTHDRIMYYTDKKVVSNGVSDLTFQEFLFGDFVSNKEKNFKNLNLEWKMLWPQTQYILSSNNRNVKVFKMENELQHVEKLVGFEFTHTRINQNPVYDWKILYDQKSLDLINAMFEEDFERFDYDQIISIENL
jgi:hypothetical protein